MLFNHVLVSFLEFNGYDVYYLSNLLNDPPFFNKKACILQPGACAVVLLRRRQAEEYKVTPESLSGSPRPE